MAVLNLKLLGRIACELGPDSQLTLSTRKAEVLLAYLALAPGVRHPRERLINLLWSDRSEEQARNSLRQALSAIKKTFTDMGVVPLEIDRSTVMLDDNQIHIDALEFEQLAKETNQKQLTKAADIYQGEFLEGINIRDMASQTWLSQQRDRYKRMIVEVLSSLCDLQLKQGQFKSAIETADRLVSFDSLHESGWRMLMKAHHDKGERNHALMAYKRCADVLNHELGVQPEPETIALRDLIRGGTQPETNLDNQELAPQIKHEGKTEKSKTSSNDEARKTGRVFDQSAILVLPFENLSNDSEQQYFSDGITEGVIVGLSMYPSLTILSRNYSFAIQDQKLTIRDIANKYKVQYVIEGSVRKTPEKLRITTQLVNAQTGEQLWGKRFDSKLEHIFSIEDELTRTIVANIQGKIDASDKEIAYRKPAKDMRSYDMLMQGKYHLGKFNPEDNRLGRIILDKCIESDPECAIAYNYLYRIYISDWLSGWTEPRDQMIEKAGEHIKKAVALAPDESIIQASYAEFLLFSRQYQQCEIHAERAFRIDPNDTETLATLSAIHAGLANVELALEMADACRTLDPFHPWIDWVNGIAYYTGKRYQDALATFKMMPNPADEIEGWIAACYERLGNPMDAEKHLHQYVKIVRKNMVTPPVTREDWHKLWQATSDFKHSNDVDHPFDALIAAGLEHYFEESASDTAIKDVHHSFPSIVVLPFDNLSGDPEQEYFSDGITESTILNLSMFNGLIVKSRHSSFAYKNSDKSIQTIAEELNAQYLVEGSIRKSPDKVRITVQLVESGSGNQLWGKRYDADLEDIFELEQELTESIAGTIGGKIGQELRKTAVKKSAKDLKSYDYFLRGMHHGMMFAPKDAVIAKQQFEKCLAIDPEYADAHASLAAMYLLDVVENWTADRQHSLKMANQHARTAIELDSQSALVQAYMAEVLFMHRDFEQGYLHAERVIELNPTLPDGYSYKAWALEGMGQFDEALECADRSLELDPHHSYAGWIAGEVYRDIGDFEKAIKAFRSLPHQPCSVTGQIAACYAGLGQLDRAKAEMQHYHDIARDQMKVYPTTVEQWRSFWYDSMPYKLDKDFDRFFDLLLQAGLCDGLDDSPG